MDISLKSLQYETCLGLIHFCFVDYILPNVFIHSLLRICNVNSRHYDRKIMKWEGVRRLLTGSVHHPQPRLLCVSKASSVCLWWEPRSLKSEYHRNNREQVPEVHGQVLGVGLRKVILPTFIMSLLYIFFLTWSIRLWGKKKKNDSARGGRWQREGTAEGCDDLSRCWTKRWNAEWEKATGAWKDVEPKDNLCDCAGRRTARVGSRISVGGPAHQKAARLKQHDG